MGRIRSFLGEVVDALARRPSSHHFSDDAYDEKFNRESASDSGIRVRGTRVGFSFLRDVEALQEVRGALAETARAVQTGPFEGGTEVSPTDARRWHRELLQFDPTLPTVCVIPSLFAEYEGSEARRAVSVEDVRAAAAIAKVLVMADPRLHVDVELADNIESPDPRNLVLICSPKRNPITSAVLRHKSVRASFHCEFVELFGGGADIPPRWVLLFEGTKIHSPSYEQELANADCVEDFALLAKFPNPWNPNATILVAAGIRGYGTWGAAEFLLNNGTKLFERTKGTDFAAVVKATVAGSSISSEFSDHFKGL